MKALQSDETPQCFDRAEGDAADQETVRARECAGDREERGDLGVAFSSWTPDRAPDAIAIGMQLLANGELRLRSQRSLPMSEAAEAHRLLGEEGVRDRLLLTTAAVG